MMLTPDQQIETMVRLRIHAKEMRDLGLQVEALLSSSIPDEQVVSTLIRFKNINTRFMLILAEINHCALNGIGVPESEGELDTLTEKAQLLLTEMLGAVKLKGKPC